MIDSSVIYEEYSYGRYKTFSRGFLGNMDTLYITSEFGNRIHPKNKKQSFHYGVDIRCPQNTRLYAPCKMTIQGVKNFKGGGLTLIGRMHYDESASNNVYVLFMHLHSVDSNIKGGTYVEAMTPLGYTGGDVGDPNAGCSTGPHLHLQVEVGGRVSTNGVNPDILLVKHNLNYVCTGYMFVGNKDKYNWVDRSGLKNRAGQGEATYVKPTQQNETDYEYIKPKPLSTVQERLAPGIWQITKLAIDGSVEGRQVCSTGVSTSTGSLANFFNTVCQQPLVEFSGDTFGNQYFWMVRRPPFDRKGWNRMLQATCLTVEEKNVISVNLGWNNNEIYSWYQYIPFYEMYGARDTTLIMPAVFFPEYAQIWGSKPLTIQSNYYSYIASGYYGSKNKEVNKSNGNEIAKNAIRDLAYLVESYAYAPFTRTGTITIVGDRRIKRGTLIHLIGTDEIFYVDSVSNSYSVSASGVERTTTLQVNRGMKARAMLDGGDNPYFSLIDWGYPDVESMIEKVDANNMNKIVSKWKVNQNAFLYLLSRRQVFGVDYYNDYDIYDEVKITKNV